MAKHSFYHDYKKIDWMAKGDQYIKEMMENMKNRQDSLMREWNKADEWTRNAPLFGN